MKRFPPVIEIALLCGWVSLDGQVRFTRFQNDCRIDWLENGEIKTHIWVEMSA